MGVPVLVMGPSGSGKSTSLMHFDPERVVVFNVSGKRLPFRKKLRTVKGSNYENIKAMLKKGKRKAYVIDDSQYLMAFESFRRAKEKGYEKNIDLAKNFKDLVCTVLEDCPDDMIVYFLHHTETTEDGKVKAKTLGKMLDNQLTLEGLFPIVLISFRDDDGYHFQTNTYGKDTAKSPVEMFDIVIDNNLDFVDKTIREYWGLEEEKEN